MGALTPLFAILHGREDTRRYLLQRDRIDISCLGQSPSLLEIDDRRLHGETINTIDFQRAIVSTTESFFVQTLLDLTHDVRRFADANHPVINHGPGLYAMRLPFRINS
jgi:hypothetical protein